MVTILMLLAQVESTPASPSSQSFQPKAHVPAALLDLPEIAFDLTEPKPDAAAVFQLWLYNANRSNKP